MKNMKKISAIGLVMLMLVAILSACGGEGNEAGNGGNGNENSGNNESGSENNGGNSGENGSGASGADLTFQQLRDTQTNTTFTLRQSTLANFERAWGEGELVHEGHWMAGGGFRLNNRQYTFLDGSVRVIFAAEDSERFDVEEDTALRIEITATDQQVAAGRLVTYEFGLGSSREEVGELAGFRMHIVTFGSDTALRRLNREGNISAPAVVRLGDYYTMLTLEDDIVVNITLGYSIGN